MMQETQTEEKQVNNTKTTAVQVTQVLADHIRRKSAESGTNMQTQLHPGLGKADGTIPPDIVPYPEDKPRITLPDAIENEVLDFLYSVNEERRKQAIAGASAGLGFFNKQWIRQLEIKTWPAAQCTVWGRPEELIEILDWIAEKYPELMPTLLNTEFEVTDPLRRKYRGKLIQLAAMANEFNPWNPDEEKEEPDEEKEESDEEKEEREPFGIVEILKARYYVEQYGLSEADAQSTVK